MKKALVGIALLNLLFACSQKDKIETVPELPPEKWVVSRITEGNDSLVFKYDRKSLVSRFADWSGNTADSFDVVYGEKGISEFKFFVFGQPRRDRTFTYTGNYLAAVNYYNVGNNGELILTDKDSLVYSAGKLAEYHVISGGVRGGVYKLAWQGDDVSKVEYFLVNGITEIPVSVNTYAYIDKIGYQHVFRGSFLQYYDTHNFSYLSARAVAKDEQKAAGTGVLMYTATYTASYNEKGVPEEVVIVKEDKQNDQTLTTTRKIEYATVK